MRNKTVVLAIAVATISMVRAPAPEMPCKEFVAMLTKKQLGGISACSKSMKFKNPKEKASKMNCILKCVLTKEGMLDADGQFVSDEKLDGFIDDIVPINLMDKVPPKFKHCKETAGQNLDTTGDEFCKSFDPLIKCMLDVIGTLCKA